MFFNGVAGGSLVRLNADGTVDTSFVALTPGNYGPGGQYNCVRVQSDGKILTVGRTNTDDIIKRFNTDGSLDAGFSFTTYTNCNEVAVQPDGKILFTYHTGSGINNYKMGRMLPDGQIDPGFAGPTNLPGVTNFTLQPDGKVLCFSDTVGNHTVFRLNADGSADTGFSFPVTQSFQSENTAHALLPDGKILMGVRLFPVFSNYFVRRNEDGSADTTFDIGSGFGLGIGYGPTVTEYISDIDVDQFGRILVGGAFRQFDGQPENAFVRLRPEGLLNNHDVQEAGKVVVYPNPASDRIYFLRGGVREICSYRIATISGGEVLSGVSDTVDVSALPAGVYLIRCDFGGLRQVVRLVRR